MRVVIEIHCERPYRLISYLYRCIYDIKKKDKKDQSLIGTKLEVKDDDSDLTMEIFSDNFKTKENE